MKLKLFGPGCNGSNKETEVCTSSTIWLCEEEVFRHQAQTAFTFKPEQVFYEDTTLQTVPVIEQAALDTFIGKVHGLLQQFRAFAGMQDGRAIMHNYFVNKYGGEATVDLFTFYEDYYREYKKPEAERQAKELTGPVMTFPLTAASPSI